MSWNVDLECVCCRQSLLVDKHEEGGTYVVGGTDKAELNVTYNYGRYFRFPELNRMIAKDAIPILEKVVERLGMERCRDYWAPTEGNVGYTVNVLLRWARQHPDGVFSVR